MPRPRGRRAATAHRPPTEPTDDAGDDAPATTGADDAADDRGSDDSATTTRATTTPATTATPTTDADDDGPRRQHRPRGRAAVVRRGQPPGPAPSPRSRRPGPAGRRRPRRPSTRAIRSRSQGLLDLRPEGYGFLRGDGYLPAQKDVYVSASQVRRFALRKGDFVTGTSRPQASNEKYPALLRVDDINGLTPDDARARPRFEDLTPLFPDAKLHLELARRPAARSPVASSTSSRRSARVSAG